MVRVHFLDKCGEQGEAGLPTGSQEEDSGDEATALSTQILHRRPPLWTGLSVPCSSSGLESRGAQATALTGFGPRSWGRAGAGVRWEPGKEHAQRLVSALETRAPNVLLWERGGCPGPAPGGTHHGPSSRETAACHLGLQTGRSHSALGFDFPVLSLTWLPYFLVSKPSPSLEKFPIICFESVNADTLLLP